MGACARQVLTACFLAGLSWALGGCDASGPGNRDRGQADANWEEDALRVSFSDYHQHQIETWIPFGPHTVTTMIQVPDRGEIWVGTTNGISICLPDGNLRRRVIQTAPLGKAGLDGDPELRRVAHAQIRRIIPLGDGKVWVKAVRGSYLLRDDGTVLDDCGSDKQAVERHYRLILSEPKLQEYYPALDGKVYFPLAGSKVGRYNGQNWDLVGQLPGSWAVRRVHLIGKEICAVGSDGVIRVSDGKYLIESKSYTEVYRYAPGKWLCAGGGVWLLDGEKPNRVADFTSAEGLGAYSPTPGVVFWSCYDDSRLHIISADKSGKQVMRMLMLPEGHRWRDFLRYSPERTSSGPVMTTGARVADADANSVIYILTSKGMVSTDLREVKEMIRVPALKSVYPEYGPISTMVMAAIMTDRAILLGTPVGLVRYDRGSKKLEWVWRAKARIGGEEDEREISD